MSERFNLLDQMTKKLIFRLMYDTGYVRWGVGGGAPNRDLYGTWPSGGTQTVVYERDDPEHYAERCAQARDFADYLEDRRYKLLAGDEA